MHEGYVSSPVGQLYSLIYACTSCHYLVCKTGPEVRWLRELREMYLQM